MCLLTAHSIFFRGCASCRLPDFFFSTVVFGRRGINESSKVPIKEQHACKRKAVDWNQACCCFYFVKTKKAQDYHPKSDHARASPLIMRFAHAWFPKGKQSTASRLHAFQIFDFNKQVLRLVLSFTT